MTEAEKAFLMADLETVLQILRDMPSEDILGRMSFESRRDKIERELNERSR